MIPLKFVSGIVDPLINAEGESVPDNTAVFTTASVMRKNAPVRQITRDIEGDWQFLPGTDLDSEEPLLVSLREMLEHDPGTRVALRLNCGETVCRDDPEKEWILSDIQQDDA